MPCNISLRAAISIVCASLVALIAAMTLGITLSTSISALREIGQSHAMSLLANANDKSTALFEQPFLLADSMRNFTMSEAWPWLSDDHTSYKRFQDFHRFLLYQTKLQSPGILTYFADNSRMASLTSEEDGGYQTFDFLPAPYSMGGRAYQATQPYRLFNVTWSSKDNTVLTVDPATTTAEPLVTTTALWQTMIAGTLNALVTTITGVYLNFDSNAPAGAPPVQDYIVVAVPLYIKGAKRGNLTQLFGVTVVSMFTRDLGSFLKDVGGTPNTFAAALDLSGFLVAVQTGAPAFENISKVSGTSSPPLGCATTASVSYVVASDVWMSCRTPAKAYPFAPLQKVAADVDFVTTATPRVTLLTVNGALWFAASARVPMRYSGLGLQLVLLLPEQDVIGNVVTGRDIAIGVTVAVVVVAGILGFALISTLLSPLPLLADRMFKASSLSDDGTEREVSALSEVRELQTAYYELNDELMRIRSFVPQSVLASAAAPDFDPDLETSLDDEIRSKMRRAETGSSRSTHVSSRRSRSSSAVLLSTSGALNTSVGLAAQMITVAVFNLQGFTAAVHEQSRTTIIDGVSDLVTTIGTAVSGAGGVLHTFHGDHIVVGFNAIKPCGSHARHAVAAALQIASSGPTRQLRLALRCGIATGRCHIGNLGSADTKGFHVIGPAFTHASLLERMCPMYRRKYDEAEPAPPRADQPPRTRPHDMILATRRTCEDIATHFRYRYLDLVRMPHAANPMLVGLVLGEVPKAAATTSGVSAEASSEWLYLVGQSSGTDRFAARNDAFRMLSEGKFDEGVIRAAVDSSASANTLFGADSDFIDDHLDETAQRFRDAIIMSTSVASAQQSASGRTADGATSRQLPAGASVSLRDLGDFFTHGYLHRTDA